MKWKKSLNFLKGKNQNSQSEEENFEINEKNLRLLFHNCSDIKFQPIKFNDVNALIMYCTGMVDEQVLREEVLPEIEQFLSENEPLQLKEKSRLEELQITSLSIVHSKEQIMELVFSGQGLIYFRKDKLLLSCDISKMPKRAIDETNMEVSIKGPRDNFIEDIKTNMALIRKRLPTNSLRSEKFIVGRRSKTTVNLLYMDDIAKKEIIEEIKNRINKIDIDAIYSGQQLMELVERKSKFFPTYDYSGRPDFIVKALVSGRIIILADGIPYAILTPSDVFLLLKSAEDAEYPAFYSSFERFIRIMGTLIAALLPGFWVAVTSFHPNQLPVTLLATVIESRKGIPLSAGLEAFTMILLFELFREAGLRLPVAVGQTLSVVGGLIIGDAAIRAGLTSPSMLVVIAASSVATYTLVNQSLVGTLSLVRFFVLFLSAFLGFFGFFISAFFILLYMANIRIFGMPYLAIAANLDIIEILRTIFQFPAQREKGRPKLFNPKDKRREGP
ncbi:spore germination protein [Metabacillus fastidiosus]|uniref:spore germination protein n=1 Tax=Metabacillus fastidiosus TaxID=1458 RepID=UPI003D2E6938